MTRGRGDEQGMGAAKARVARGDEIGLDEDFAAARVGQDAVEQGGQTGRCLGRGGRPLQENVNHA